MIKAGTPIVVTIVNLFYTVELTFISFSLTVIEGFTGPQYVDSYRPTLLWPSSRLPPVLRLT